MQLSGGPYSYNRFDSYESSLEEEKGASDPEKMKKKVDKAAKKSRKTGRDLRDEDKKDEAEEETSTAEGGDGGGMSEELNNDETTETVMENRMAMYSRALGVMGAHYSGPSLDEKKADKDYDGDGKVESSKEEYFGSKDKAIKKAMAKEEVTVEEGYKEMDPQRAENQAKGKGRGSKAEQGRKIRLASAAHNDPKVGGMARAAVKDQAERNKAKGENKRGLEKAFKKDSKGHSSMEEEVSLTKEMVVEYLVTEGYATNEVSAEILHTHVSDEFLAQIEEQMLG
jgi:hypothetical protein